MDQFSLGDLRCIEPQIELWTRSLASVNESMARTFEKMDALHVELARRAIKTQIPFGNDKQK